MDVIGWACLDQIPQHSKNEDHGIWPHHFMANQFHQFSRSVVSDSATPQTAARQASLSITNSRSLFKLMSIESVMLSNHLILYRPLLLPPSNFPSIRVFFSESGLCISWANYSGLNSFWIDWFDLLAIQGTLKRLL